jgi:predicted GIY-YIG superfamily endonuclease
LGSFLIKIWQVYICDRNGKLYTGITTNLGNRMRQHGAKLLYSETYLDRFQAAKREKQIKG